MKKGRRGKYRDRFDIFAHVLESARNGALKTNIMYSANLSFHLNEKYLNVCLENGLIEKTNEHYVTTKKGREYLKHYYTLRALTEKSSKIHEALQKLLSEAEKS